MYRVEMERIKHTTDNAHLIQFSSTLETWVPKSDTRIFKGGVLMENWLFNKNKYLFEGNTEYCYVGE